MSNEQQAANAFSSTWTSWARFPCHSNASHLSPCLGCIGFGIAHCAFHLIHPQSNHCNPIFFSSRQSLMRGSPFASIQRGFQLSGPASTFLPGHRKTIRASDRPRTFACVKRVMTKMTECSQLSEMKQGPAILRMRDRETPHGKRGEEIRVQSRSSMTVPAERATLTDVTTFSQFLLVTHRRPCPP